MKQVSPPIVEAIKNGTAVKALPEVVIDWNMNRYHDTRVDNTPAEQDAAYDIELFPIESLTEPLRPGKGINKARIGQSTISREYYDVGGEQDARFYIADQDDTYKYWTSPQPAVGGTIPLFNTSNFTEEEYEGLTGHDNLTSARPKVEYGVWNSSHTTFTVQAVRSNKIVIQLENTWATPNQFSIIIGRTEGNVTIPHTALSSGWEGPGTIVLRWNGTSWAHDNVRVDDPVTGFPVADSITSITLSVQTMKGGYQKTAPGEPLVKTKYVDATTNTWHDTDGSDSFLDVIEIGAHLEANLSPWLLEVDDTFDMSETSQLYPLGTITSNVASMSLSNAYTNSEGETVLGLFSYDNDDDEVIWSRYLEPNAEVKMAYVYYDGDDNVIGKVKQFTMYTDDWSGQSNESVGVELADYSKFLNEQILPAVMWEELKVPEILWKILDTVGFTDYHIDRESDSVTEHTIPVFFSNGEDSVWAVLDELAKASQTAIYFDAEGVLQVKTRDFAFSPTDAPVWTFQTKTDTNQLSNVVTLEQMTEYEPNRIKVIYQKTNWSAWNQGQPTMQKVWEPEDETEVLRGTALTRDLNLGDEYIWINPEEVKIWPFEGMVNIEGEIIKFKGKQFRYFTGPGATTAVNVVVESNDERRDIQREKVEDGYQYKSNWTGALKIDRDEFGDLQRGFWNTEPRAHLVEATGYTVRQRVNNEFKANVKGFTHLKKESKVELMPGSRHKDYGDILVATRGAVDDSPFYHYGTKLKFVKQDDRTTQCAGIVIHNASTQEDGYYFELTPSKRLGGAERKSRGELIVYSRVGNKEYRIGSADLAIAEEIEYDLDVSFSAEEGTHTLQVWVNGKRVMSETVSGTRRAMQNGKFGLFARGKTRVQYEFLYAVRVITKELPDDFSFLDKSRRGYTANQFDREWVYEWREYRRKVKKKWVKERRRKNKQFFDEFGPIVHEIREYNVKFDPNPILHSRLYITNDWSAVCVDYRSDPFGAKFTIANTSRFNAVIQGEDSLSFAGTGQVVNQFITVLGRPLIIEDAEEVIAENTDQIRMRGKNEVDLSSPWIQSKSMARELARWIRENFTYGNESITIEAFGNPLIEVGDVVRVEAPEKHVSGDFFVTATRNSFSEGLSTSFDLRRRV